MLMKVGCWNGAMLRIHDLVVSQVKSDSPNSRSGCFAECS